MTRKRDSITCPKCERISYHRGDILHGYCAVCGYHDVPLDTPHGVPGVSAKFRQPTPAMQIQAMLGAFEGQFHNWVEGIGTDEKLKTEFTRFRDDLLEIVEHLGKAEWVQPRRGPPPPAGGGIL